MYIRKSHRLKKPIKIIYPGECYVSTKDEYIGTLLGSCVAVCLYDLENQVSGMNHFMLPGKVVNLDKQKKKPSLEKISKQELLKYGTQAINELLKKMLEHGKKKNIVAKIFGGGKVLEYQGGSYGISNMNVRLAKILLEMADIPIVSQDIGGNVARKVIFEVKTGKAYCKKLTKGTEEDLLFDGVN